MAVYSRAPVACLTLVTACLVFVILNYDSATTTLAGFGAEDVRAVDEPDDAVIAAKRRRGRVPSSWLPTKKAFRTAVAEPKWLASDGDDDEPGDAKAKVTSPVAAASKGGKPGKAPKPPKPPKPPPAPVLPESEVFPTKPLVNVTDRDPRRGLRIALVGNGRGVIKHKKGAKIDAHDLVGRFNFFKTKGFEQHCGSRVDLWQGLLPGPGREWKLYWHSTFHFFFFGFRLLIPNPNPIPISYFFPYVMVSQPAQVSWAARLERNDDAGKLEDEPQAATQGEVRGPGHVSRRKKMRRGRDGVRPHEKRRRRVQERSCWYLQVIRGGEDSTGDGGDNAHRVPAGVTAEVQVRAQVPEHGDNGFGVLSGALSRERRLGDWV